MECVPDGVAELAADVPELAAGVAELVADVTEAPWDVLPEVCDAVVTNTVVVCTEFAVAAATSGVKTVPTLVIVNVDPKPL